MGFSVHARADPGALQQIKKQTASARFCLNSPYVVSLRLSARTNPGLFSLQFLSWLFSQFLDSLIQ